MFLVLLVFNCAFCDNSTTTDNLPIINVPSSSSPCTFPGQSCGNVDSPLSDVNLTMYLCANGICICNFIYLTPTWKNACNLSSANVDQVLRNTVNPQSIGTVPQSIVTKQCDALRAYRQCVANILGKCASVATNRISNQPDNCTVKWRTYSCPCHSFGSLCFTQDGTSCVVYNDPKVTAGLNSACNGVCNALQPDGNTANVQTLTPSLLLILVLAFEVLL